MSSPDFPGPSWQNSSEPFDDTGLYRDESAGYQRGNGRADAADGYGRTENGYSGSGNGYSGSGNGYSGSGDSYSASYSGYSGSGNGYSGSGNGYSGSGNGYSGSGDGYSGSYSGSGDGYGSTGRHPAGGYGSNGGGARGNGSARRDPGYGSEFAAGNGYSSASEYAGGPGYGGRSTSGLDGGTRGWGSGGAGAPDGGTYGWEQGGAGAPGGPDGPGGPGRRGGRGVPGGSRGRGRPARGFVDPGGPDGPGGPGRTGGRPPRPPGNWAQRQWHARWWRHWSLKKAALLTGCVAVGTVLVMVAGFFYFYSTVSVPAKVVNTDLGQSSVVYFANGKEVGCFCSVNRTNLTQQQVADSKWLVAAVTAAEDRNFFHEGGVSLTGIIRAAKNDILGGGSLQGGSTITEELVKQYYDSSYLGNLTIRQKLDEIIVSIKLAHLENKLWVMTHYLNTIYFGADAFGAQAAAETYFGKPAWKLDAAQAAMMAAMIQSPSDYDPTHPDKSVPGLGSLAWRWKNEVLANMVKDGNISAATANSLTFPKVTIRAPDTTWPGYKGYIMTVVEDELEAYYNIQPDQIGSMGLQIHTTIDQGLMNALYKTVSQIKGEMASYGAPLPWYVNIGAVLEQPGTGGILAFYGGPGYNLPTKRCLRIHCQNPTILDHAPVGSSFKPYVLTTAVSQGMNAMTSITNSHSPLCIPPADDTETLRLQLSKQTMNCDTQNGYYSFVEGSENTPGKNLTVPEATAVSNNASYMDLIHRTGVNNVIEMAQKLGVYPTTIGILKGLFWSCGGCKSGGQFPGAVNAALGEGSMTPVDQANTFATLVSNGTSATPHVIKYIVQNGTTLPSKVVISHPLAPYVAADADYALSFDTNPAYGGTGVPNAEWNRPMIAKTGTLGSGVNSSAAWFLGAIPQYSMAVSMFTDNLLKQNLDGLPAIGGWTGGYGGAWPATIWHTFMSENFNNLPIMQLPTTNFSAPEFTKWVQALPVKPVCPKTPGNGNGGNGHHHFPFFSGPGKTKKCPGSGPSPSPFPSFSPSPIPSASPSPIPTFPSPIPSFSAPPFSGQHKSGPSPAAAKASDTAAVKGSDPVKAPKPGRGEVAAIPSLTTAAILVGPTLRKPTWTVLTTGLT